jgi:peptidoglycan/xylan/chitin deacetylase (PgdA/CDA1 family)
MRGISDGVVRAVLDGLYFSGVYHLMAPVTAGRGVIFMLHRVRPAPPAGAFAPNGMLEVTPEFLDAALSELARREVEIVDLDEASRRLGSKDRRRFAVFTFDDGYVDNLDIALPIFEAHNAPFTIYVTTGVIDGKADIWWLLLEEAIARSDVIRMRLGETALELPARSAEEKQAAWDAIYWPLRDLSIAERRSRVAELADRAGITEAGLFAGLAPSWERLRKAAHHRLVRLGAHTIHHFPLSALNEVEARHEMDEGRRQLEAKIGHPVKHFAYPYGNAASAAGREFALARELGFSTAVTGRPGPLFSEHAQHLHALPRISLNGGYQAMRYVALFLSGAPFALFNRGRKLNVA